MESISSSYWPNIRGNTVLVILSIGNCYQGKEKEKSIFSNNDPEDFFWNKNSKYVDISHYVP